MIWPISLLTRTEKGSRLNKEEFDENYGKIAEGLNTLYDSKLDKTAAAADSAKLGGLTADDYAQLTAVQALSNKTVPNLKFSNTLSSDARTLDFYEEGTFTPSITGSSTAGAATYTTQIGRYTRVGNIVKIELTLAGSFSSAPTGVPVIGGLPFTSSTTAAFSSVGAISGGYQVSQVFPYVQTSSSAVRLVKCPSSISINKAVASFGTDVSDSVFNMNVSIQYTAN